VHVGVVDVSERYVDHVVKISLEMTKELLSYVRDVAV